MPAKVMTSRLVQEVFGLESEVITDPVSGTPLMVPRGRHRVLPAPVTDAD